MTRTRYANLDTLSRAVRNLSIPWAAVGLFAVSIGTVIAAALTFSLLNNRTTSHWYSQPAIVLAVISSIFSLSTGVATSFGVAVLWWRAASKGTQVKNLHLIWDRGMGREFFVALAGDSQTRRTALATLLIAAARFSAGPLLQRAVGQISELHTQTVPLKIWFSETLEPSFAAAAFFRENETYVGLRRSDMSAAYLQRFEENDPDAYFNGRTYLDDLRADCPFERPGSCNGFVCPRNSTCTASVRGVGLTMNCSRTSSKVDLQDPANIGLPVFMIDFSIANLSHPRIRLTTIYNNQTSDNCTAELIDETCDIRTAMVDYIIRLRWGNFTYVGYRGLDPEQLYSSPYDNFALNDHTIGQREEGGPLASLYAVFVPYYQTVATLSSPNSILDSGFNAERFGDGTKSANVAVCGGTFTRPSTIILSKMMRYLFNALQLTGTGTQVYQNVTASEEYPILVHHLDSQYVAAALVVMLVGIISAATLFWGFWELERTVTLSPVETGKALDAPMLATTSEARTVDEILSKTGRRRTKYDGKVFRGISGFEMEDSEGHMLPISSTGVGNEVLSVTSVADSRSLIDENLYLGRHTIADA